MPRPWWRPARLSRSDSPSLHPLASRFAAIPGARSGAVIRTWATYYAGSAAGTAAAVAAELGSVILAPDVAAWATAAPVRSAGLAAAAGSSIAVSATAERGVGSAAERAVRAAFMD